MLRLITRQADWWNISQEGVEPCRRLIAECERACDEVGREPISLRRSWFGVCLCAENEAELHRLNTRNLTTNRALIGTPQQVIEQIQSFIELGIEHFELSLPSHHEASRQCLELLASDVLPTFKRG